MSGAVVAAILYVVVFRQRRQQGRTAVYLAEPAQNNLCPPSIKLHRPVDFDDVSGEPANVSDILEIVSENDDCKRACHLVFAEIQEVHALRCLHAHDFARDALSFADMLRGLLKRNAVGCRGADTD